MNKNYENIMSFIPYTPQEGTLYACHFYDESDTDSIPIKEQRYFYNGKLCSVDRVVGFGLSKLPDDSIGVYVALCIDWENGWLEDPSRFADFAGLGGTFFGDSNALTERHYQHNPDGSYTLIDEVPA